MPLNDDIYTVNYNFAGRKVCADIKFRPDFFSSDSSVYSSDIAEFCAVLAMIGYDLPYGKIPPEEKGIHKVLTEMGMEDIRFDTGTGPDEVDGIFSSIHTEVSGEPAVIVSVCFVGSHHHQWYTNFDSGTGSLHKSFSLCESNEYKKLEAYLGDVCRKNEKIIIVVSGHSRGAATAGILAEHLKREEKFAASSDIFAYTFASPAYILSSGETKEIPGIFNFINEEDFVVRCMPGKWGYDRYGKTIILPNKTDFSDYDKILSDANSYYRQYTAGDEYEPFRKGTAAVNKLVDKLCDSVNDIEEFYNKKFRSPIGKVSLQTYFLRSLCTVTAERDFPEKSKPGFMLLLKSTLLRHKSSGVIKAVSDFFVFHEGLGGITNGKVFKSNFSSTHDMTSYCALVMALRNRTEIS